jgi:hypothetical protein
MKTEGFSMSGLALAASALAFPWSTVLMVVAFGLGGVCLFGAYVDQIGSTSGDPSRCPACNRDELMRIETATLRARVPLLHCRHCGEAYRWFGNTLIRDTGGAQLP